jgi:hypothetical protein
MHILALDTIACFFFILKTGFSNLGVDMTRWKASGIHLFISGVIAALVFVLLFFVWYPGALFEAAGGERLVYILIGIDIVIGPLLTLVIFRAGKKGLNFDLACIGIAQVAALLYGLSVITSARPLFVVFAVDRYIAVSNNQLDDADLQAAKDPRYRKRSWTGPQWVAAQMPTDPDESAELMFSGLNGKDVERFPKYYIPYQEHAKLAGQKSKPIDDLRPKLSAPLNKNIAAMGSESSLGWLPLVARGKDATVILERDSGKILDIIDIDPW